MFMGMFNDVAIIENSAEVLKNLYKNTVFIWFGDPNSQYKSNDQSKIFKKYLHNQVHHNVFHSKQ
jgi:hypothetical protein